jgi:hypothetical protein
LTRWQLLLAGPQEHAVTSDQFAATLAERVMGWGVAPDRFLLGGRRWLPRWRFQPLTRIEDAFQVLEKAATTFTLTANADGTFAARVRVGKNRPGSASGISKATVISTAVGRAIGLDLADRVDSEKP